MIHERQMPPREFRAEYITAHGIGLQSLAYVGRDIIQLERSEQLKKLEALSRVDWRKANTSWRERAMHHGRLSKARSNIFLTSIEIKRQIGLNLSNDELTKEQEYLRK